MKLSLRFCQKDHFIYYQDESYGQRYVIGVCTNKLCSSKLVCEQCIDKDHRDHKEMILLYDDLKQMVMKNFGVKNSMRQNDRAYYNQQQEQFKAIKQEIYQVIQNYEKQFISICQYISHILDLQGVIELIQNEDWAQISDENINMLFSYQLQGINEQKLLQQYQAYNVQIVKYQDTINKLGQQITCALKEIDFSQFFKQHITLKDLSLFYENNQLDYSQTPMEYVNIKGIVVGYISTEFEHYYGELNEKNIRQGKGMQIQIKGQIVYEGIWSQNSLIWGQKTQYSEKGECIILRGKMQDKKLLGEGMKITSFGENYVGYFHNDIIEGQGHLINAQGDDYQGGFSEGKMHGKGVLIYEGNGKQEKKYEGNFKNGLKQGDGILYYTNGDIYEGQFYRDQQHGKGVYRCQCGIKYNGSFKYGKKDGEGVVIFANGDKEIGIFNKNQKQGLFKFFKANSQQPHRMVNYYNDMEIK